jgi:hypothetical protein
MSKSFALRASVLAFGLALCAHALAQQPPLPPGFPATTTTTTYTPAPQAPQQTPATYQDAAPPAPVAQSPAAAVPPQEAGKPAIAGQEQPLTASEQGYTGNTEAMKAAMMREAADAAAMDTPRQRGEKLTVPSFYNPVSANWEYGQWLANWKDRLVGIGVAPAKVDFESRRLTQEDFAMWASRMVWALQGDAPRQSSCCAR